MAHQLRVVHRTGFRYAQGVSASHNEARMTPRSTREQFVLATKLEISPVAWTHAYRDYWGTHVTAFEIAERHERLNVVSTSTVDVSDRIPRGQHVSWGVLAHPVLIDEQIEMLAISQHVEPPAELKRLASAARRSCDLPAQAAQRIIDQIRERVAYVPGSTEVNTRASSVWEAGAGVCQDLVHLALGGLRSVGIPARYVSGYVVPSAQAAVGELTTAESHAWLQFWDGDWVGLDPTNDAPPGDFHVEVGYGRDYFDVPPLKGVYSGSRSSDMFVEVEITVLA